MFKITYYLQKTLNLNLNCFICNKSEKCHEQKWACVDFYRSYLMPNFRCHSRQDGDFWPYFVMWPRVLSTDPLFPSSCLRGYWIPPYDKNVKNHDTRGTWFESRYLIFGSNAAKIKIFNHTSCRSISFLKTDYVLSCRKWKLNEF